MVTDDTAAIIAMGAIAVLAAIAITTGTAITVMAVLAAIETIMTIKAMGAGITTGAIDTLGNRDHPARHGVGCL
jgi:hypothetical protein